MNADERKRELTEIVKNIADYGKRRKFRGTIGDRRNINWYVFEIMQLFKGDIVNGKEEEPEG